MLTLSVLNDDYSVCQLPPDAPLPHWATAGDLFAVVRTPQEWSAVCRSAQVPPDVRQDAGWAALVLHGPFEFTLTGILASVLNPLAEAGVGIFALSTFDTDYVLIKRVNLARTVSALRTAGHTVQE
ncbi:ACT domain-containing protein [Deinococcus sonorensis]|uniref:ACT domain-containing protein n=2 Tax=Deinococcus sonorensis TaxID=309891 RepID=A0AAU7U8E2_9DEIO